MGRFGKVEKTQVEEWNGEMKSRKMRIPELLYDL